MAVNLDKPDRWKADVTCSVDMYNQWFLGFAPATFRATRIKVTAEVEASLKATNYMRNVTPDTFLKNPAILPTLRMSTCPPLAVDRLQGLSGAPPTLVKSLDKDSRVPPKASKAKVDAGLDAIAQVVMRLADHDLFVWLRGRRDPSKEEVERAAMIVADRLCGSQANPIIRNAQEQRQLAAIKAWLKARGYSEAGPTSRGDFRSMRPGTFSFRLNVVAKLADESSTVNIPVDAVVMPKNAAAGTIPLLIEAKSAGDFTNTNKRRKEEAIKISLLRATYGDSVRFILFLCGYFDSGYLGYEAAEGIDWVWEHRIDDLAEFLRV